MIFFNFSVLVFNTPLLAFSRFEEKFEETNSVEPPASVPPVSSSDSNENQVKEIINVDRAGNETEAQAQQAHQIYSDLNSSQEVVGGMMKIVPSDVDVSALFLLQLLVLVTIN